MPGSLQMFGSGAVPTSLPGSTTAGPFTQGNDMLKTTTTNVANMLQPNFAGNHVLSLSPSGQMMRTGYIANGTPTTQARPSAPAAAAAVQGWGMPSTLPGGMLNGAGSFGHIGANQQPAGASSPGRMVLPPAPIDDLSTVQFSEEIQNEANMYFQQIYSQHMQMPVADFIERLKQFKASNLQRDKDVLGCVIKNLFEEYRFFHEYPERELRTTAEVYGSIIREGVISKLHFATAVRKVIESLQAEPGTMLWTFGTVALNACRTKLSAYPKVCVMIAKQRNFQHFPPHLKVFFHACSTGKLILLFLRKLKNAI
ncbi:unnamed protein product [Gongylonema pulchrum]|uniref:CNOT1_TTP_bind domain-containing protein n=1 Tax=Gongylonema pulchrum TaxID=637853 RepID=A0A183EHQ4_9BILA|nr:unnamed protein product [Gongylonema pulchrum]